MCVKKIDFILIVAIFAIAVWGETLASPNETNKVLSEAGIIHLPVTSLRENEKLVVEGRVDGAKARVVFMRLYFKSQTQESYDYVEMSNGTSGYFGELSPDKFNGNNLSYFILAMLEDGKVITYPQQNPYGNPLKVVIAAGGPSVSEPPQQETTPFVQPEPNVIFPEEDFELPSSSVIGDDSSLLFLSPEAGDEFGVGEDIVIAVSFFSSGSDSIDVNSINLFVDGMNVTLDSEVSDNVMTYITSSLLPGGHSAFLQGYFHSGVELPHAEIAFIVKGERPKSGLESPVKGRVFAETRHESISDVGYNDNNMGGFLSGKHGIVQYDAKLYLTTREDSQFQPRNRYSFNLELPFIGVTVGDFYPRFNDLMLWGKRVRGLHGRLRLGFFNVDLVTGQTVRRVAAIDSTVLDALGQVLPNSAGSDSTAIVTTGRFRQNLLGLRTSFGTGRNFQFGLNLLKAKDDSTGLGPNEYATTPQDNVVIGSDLMIGFANRRIEFRAGAAYSLITEDILGGPLSKAEIEEQFPDFDLPINPADFADYLIINLSTKPLDDPRKGKSLALNSSFRFNFFNNNFVIGYKRIGGEYVSLGNSFLRSNLRGFYFQDRIRLLQNKLYLNFGFENYDDNFAADDENTPTKLKTLNTGFTIYPGAHLPNFTFNLRNHNRDDNIDSLFIDINSSSLVADTTHVGENNNTRDFSLQMNYDTHFMNLNHAISISYIKSDRTDDFVQETENASNVQVVSVRTKYQFPLITTFNFARNDNNFGDGLNTFNFKMFGFKAEYPFLNQKVKTYLGTNYTSASGTSSSDSTTLTSVTDYNRLAFNAGARFDISRSQYIALDASLISFKDGGLTVDTSTTPATNAPNPSFTDRSIRVFYEKRF